MKKNLSAADTQAILDAFMEASPIPAFFRDRDFRISLCNDEFCALFDLSKEEITGRLISDICSGSPEKAFKRADNEISRMEGSSRQSFTLKKRGHDEFFQLNITSAANSDGAIIGTTGTISDMGLKSDKERSADRVMRLKDAILSINNSIQELNNQDELFSLILEKVLSAVDHAVIGCVLLLDENRQLRIASSRGYPPAETGDFRIKVEDTFHWKEANSEPKETLIINDLQNFLEKHNMPDTLLTDNKGRTIRSTMSAPLLINGSLYGLFNLDSWKNNIFDDTDRALMECVRSQIPIAISMFKNFERTTYESEHDKLTNLYNRRYFESILELILKRSERYKDSFCLVLFDLNDLKKINDTYSHSAGDEMLLHFAGKMSGMFRSSDIFARFGGDEFIAVCFGKDNRCKTRIEKQRSLIENQPFHFEGRSLSCKFSFGISHYQTDGTDYKSLLSAADSRMYEDKAVRKKLHPWKAGD